MLTIFADQCVNRDLAEALQTLPDTKVVRAHEVSLATAPDREIFEYARKENFVLFTSDKDFGDIRIFDPRKAAGVVIVYVENFSRESLISERKEFFESRSPEFLHGK